MERLLPGPYRQTSTLFRQGLRLDVWIDARHAAFVPDSWDEVGPDPSEDPAP